MLRTRVKAGPLAGVVLCVAFASLATLVAHDGRVPWPGGAATFAIDAALFLVTAIYLRRFGPSRTRLLRTQIGLLGAMTAVVVVAKVLSLYARVSPLWLPLGVVGLWYAPWLGRRAAIVIHVLLALLVASLFQFAPAILLPMLASGIGALLLLANRKQPRRSLVAGAGGGLVAAIILVAVSSERRFVAEDDLARGASSLLLACLGGGVLAGVLATLLHDPAERLLGVVSRERLIALTDLEHPLLQKMAREAPGSWEHSRAMANLAEAAAAAIGADALLTRVGAYFHDLGKTIQPKYFVENLLAGETSPHEALEPDVSADAIMAHVAAGAKILREGGVPEPVVEFAYTHHGTQTVEFFWHRCKERGNPKNLGEEFFRYPGMRPQTKETAILMLVDSIEAASRTIHPPERAKFDEMIQRVLFTKMRSGQLDDSGLTIEDFRILAQKMTDTLVGMNHSRIKYPWQESASNASPEGKG